MKLVEVAKVGDYVEYGALISKNKRYAEIPREHMKWRVLKNDGKNVFLISETPTKSEINLFGAKGYLDGPNILDKICKELYSSAIGIARNLKVEDVNELLDYKNPDRKIDNGLLNIKKVISGVSKKTISELENKFHKKLQYRKTPDGKDVGEYHDTYYMYDGSSYKPSNTIKYKLIFGEYGDYKYWLSSSSVFASFGHSAVSFDMRIVKNGYVETSILYVSKGNNFNCSNFCRPVVTLTPSLDVRGEQVNGRTVETAWIIK